MERSLADFEKPRAKVALQVILADELPHALPPSLSADYMPSSSLKVSRSDAFY
jgi:hypothetical protein